MTKEAIKKAVCITLLACLLNSAQGLSSRQYEDFSGEWILNREMSSFGLALLEKLEKAVATIVHKEPSFVLKRVFTLDGQDDSLTLELTTDGKERVSEEGDRKLFSRLYWEDDDLVFFTRIVTPQGEATNRVRYRLLENGRILRAEEKFVGPGLKYENVWVFVRKSYPPLRNRSLSLAVSNQDRG